MSNKDGNKNLVEFLITLNDNIVVRREFKMDNYNRNVKNSVEWYEYMYDLKDWVERFMISLSIDYMSENADRIMSNPEILKSKAQNNNEMFNILIKVDDELIGHRTIDSKLFPPEVRYGLNIKKYLSDIRFDLVKLLSSKKSLTREYLGYDLSIN